MIRIMMKKLLLLCVTVVMGSGYAPAQNLDLKDITKGEFRGESMAAVKPLSDGESYAQLSRRSAH